MRIDLHKLHDKAKTIFDRESLGKYPYRVVAFTLDSKGRLLSQGWNQYTRTHPMQKSAAVKCGCEEKQYLHAEIHSLSRLNRKQIGRQHSIVVFRMDHKKNLLPGKPCNVCSSVIENFGIENIIHS